MPEKCGAKTRSGVPCKNWAMENGRCRLHGGKTPKGIASPHWKHGRYSKYLPQGILDRYQAFANDPETLSLESEIAIIDTRLSMLFERWRDGDYGGSWDDIEKLFTEFDNLQYRASRSADEQERKSYLQDAFEKLNEIKRIVKVRKDDAALWSDIHEAIEYRRKLVDSEARRRIQMEQMLTAEQALSYATMLGLAVKQYVTDRDTLNKIQDAFVRLMRSGNSKGSSTG